MDGWQGDSAGDYDGETGGISDTFRWWESGTSDWKIEVSRVTLVGDDDGDTVDGELLVHSALGGF